MGSKKTTELEKILGSTHIRDINEYFHANADSIVDSDTAFFTYFKNLIKEKHIKQQDVFLNADIPERYGYKLLTGEKRTKQRDIIIRLCYAAEFNIEETQKALKLYRMPELYAKVPRDAVIMIAFNERPGSIIEVNQFLKDNRMDTLRSSGVQE